jgi:hypothetical protein
MSTKTSFRLTVEVADGVTLRVDETRRKIEDAVTSTVGGILGATVTKMPKPGVIPTVKHINKPRGNNVW